MNTERIYQAEDDNQWYYSRRGEHAGPFASEKEATGEPSQYIGRKHRSLNSDLLGSGIDLMKSMFRKIAA